MYPCAKVGFIIPHVKPNEIFYPLENVLASQDHWARCLRGRIQPPDQMIIMVTITSIFPVPGLCSHNNWILPPKETSVLKASLLSKQDFPCVIIHRGFIFQVEIQAPGENHRNPTWKGSVTQHHEGFALELPDFCFLSFFFACYHIYGSDADVPSYNFGICKYLLTILGFRIS